MLSVEAQNILRENGYSVYEKDGSYTFSYAKKPIGVYFFILAFVLVSVPLLLIFATPIYALAAGLLSVFPAYRILNSTEVPDSVTINLPEKSLDLISFNGVKSKSIAFRQIKGWGVRMSEQMGDANAFEKESSKVIYYLCVSLATKTLDVLKIVHNKGGDLKVLKHDLAGLTGKVTKHETVTSSVAQKLIHG